ncbi:MAG: reverse transcriptase/maturase family protein [archaeon]
MINPYYFFHKIHDLDNLLLAYKKAHKGKTRKSYVIKFERDLERNLLDLQFEIKNQFYKLQPLKKFILHDPKTRTISVSDFRDRVVHHAIINITGPMFEKSFIYDSCANQKGKGNLFAIKRFEKFMKKVSRNGTKNSLIYPNHVKGHCFKADIKHYFQEIDLEILLSTIQRKIKDKKVMWLIKKIVSGGGGEGSQTQKGMPLGNLTSQFFANVYLNELDYYVKHVLKVKYYLRYVDDFAILHVSHEQLSTWKNQINEFLKENLKLELHPQKSRIIRFSRGIDFVGFRISYHHKLLRKRNLKAMKKKIELYSKGAMCFSDAKKSYDGWNTYAHWANTHKLRKNTKRKIIDVLWEKI